MKPHLGLTIFQLSTGANRAEEMNVINQENVQYFQFLVPLLKHIIVNVQ
jgi:hypothetical protein